ncbi:MAG: TRAP transporter small permease [Aminobacterium sp.]|jgi:C4-dicarboxylate transporter DctQ subunit|uniref:TRAP transporter small permease n=1 Tax=unclassified Aminobacterium TaxID=2685012 RepID=UPI001BCB4DCD|nr:MULTISPECIES: TRAP transporter small permease [unclassified Aminobacterium]MDD2205929.1 TRAP transporter small permease [Aminobacterium sp.]MDD3426922.1 TRAP transporter small permease [Aminobacterium sp.]MDD3708518.1 TRAP transporter small permease [Aminobacterium sp.]MDD4227914.1 TRAP transporter small permease [Aminobacterium sp.]MDD4550646.1 TRAP transporter small permease [Aminobacterium sp.]
MKLLYIIDNLCERFEKFVVSWSIIIMALVAIVNVIGRNLFHHSLTWAEEVTQFTIVWVTFVGTSYAARIGAHIRMSALFDFLGPKARKILMIIVCAGTAALMFYLSWFAYVYVAKLAQINKQTLGLHIPLYLIMLWVPVGFVMTGIQYVLALIKNLTSSDVYVSRTVIEGHTEDEESFDF